MCVIELFLSHCLPFLPLLFHETTFAFFFREQRWRKTEPSFYPPFLFAQAKTDCLRKTGSGIDIFSTWNTVLLSLFGFFGNRWPKKWLIRTDAFLPSYHPNLIRSVGELCMDHTQCSGEGCFIHDIHFFAAMNNARKGAGWQKEKA